MPGSTSRPDPKPNTPIALKSAYRLRWAVPLAIFIIALVIELSEEFLLSRQLSDPIHFHRGFVIEVTVFGLLGAAIAAAGLHVLVKIVEQLEAARSSEQALLQTLRQREEERRRLLAATIQAQEAERQRVARELHDSIGQPLTTFMLAAKPNEDQPIDPHLQLAQRASAEALEAMRRLILDLRPALLDAQGLLPALHQCARDTLESNGIQIEIESTGQPQPLSDAAETALFRIAQEAFTNILRHAEAKKVTVRLAYQAQQAILTVADDGQGFDPQRSADHLGLGLLSMRERAEQVNGALQLESQPGQGTWLQVQVPLDREEEA